MSEQLRNTMTLCTCRVRHEAGEALGAIGTTACLKELQQYVQDSCLEVCVASAEQTCIHVVNVMLLFILHPISALNKCIQKALALQLSNHISHCM